ncbi:PaaX family transcriptional regulator C-terminal domain-containing protein [Litoreibacter roseus]|uniref:Phenylacetic acid degradation operon negative regulatory protein n=1 Tax=Litoreibacter roseus TaxID=2601869 RepID=A0A6N6JDX4_9RHOB|nr:PaaX family transcriptional regulator C-terminal domain-containing protein [Litoreibacter roseus]GFE64325.1 phenylacetic acid degradation operon negative regulatory protein [Litoreibacter roseus]
MIFTDLPAFSSLPPLKVWSVLVTAFGDLAIDDGATLSGPVLSALLAPLGIKQEAVRTALHRLKKDNWIVSRKEGRVSHYSLTDHARAQVRLFQTHVYAPSAASEDAKWYLIVTEPGAADIITGAVRIGRRMWLHTQMHTEQMDALVTPVDAQALPGWVTDAALQRLGAGHQTLSIALDALAEDFPDPGALPPFQAASLRLLILHQWRRIALRYPVEIETLFSSDWAGAQCRQKVVSWLSKLPPPDPETFSIPRRAT